MQSHFVRALMAVAILALVVAGCGQHPTSPSSISPSLALTAPGARSGHTTSEAPLSAEVNRQLAELRSVFGAFHNVEHAQAAGYSVPLPAAGVCVSDPVRGGMGYHYTRGDKDLIGDGVVNLFEPEFVVYSPQSNGGVKFSALDYFVPYPTWTATEPPSLLGIPFHREDAFQAWVLHIWLFWQNPAGLFENFNPAVPQCPAP